MSTDAKSLAARLTPGSRWVDTGTGEVVVIDRVRDIEVWWHHPGETARWYSDLFDFLVWGQYRPV